MRVHDRSKRRSRRRVVDLVRAVLLGVPLSMLGCSVGPKFKPPQATLQDQWRTTNDPRIAARAAADNQWWRAFDDPILDRLIDLAYHQNLPLQIAGLRIVEARARVGVATGRQYPQIQAAFANATGVGLSRNAFYIPLARRNFMDYQLGFDATWELDFWGKYRRGVESEGDSLLASLADYYWGIVSLNAEVARTYVVIRTFEVLLDQVRENVRLQEIAFQVAQSRFRNGATSELDPTQAATLLESTRADAPQLQAGLELGRHALSTLLGQPVGTVEAMLTGPAQIPRAPGTVAIGMPADILRRRPDVRSAELSAAAQCARIGIAKAELYPSFSLFGTIGLEATGTRISSFFSADSIFYQAGPRVTLPVLNYGRLENAVRVEDARFQQSLVGYRNTVLRAAQEVEDALAGYVNAQQGLVFEQNAVKAALRAVEIAVVQYREGAADFQRVIEAQRSLLQQQIALTQTSSSIATNLIALYKALGGGWELHAAERVVPEGMEREMKERTNWGDVLSEPRAQEKSNKPPPPKP